MQSRVLVVDDDQEATDTLAALLRAEDVAVVVLTHPATALDTFAWLQPDLLVLNARLADGQSLALLHVVHRDYPATVILLRGRGDEDARITALTAGADDYIAISVRPREIAARIDALLRRLGADVPVPVPVPLTIGPLTLSAAAHTVTLAGADVTLTATEFRLLAHLMAHPGEVQSFAVLLRDVWGYPHMVVSDVVRSTVYRLRQKLRDDPADPRFIHTIPGVGFVLRVIPGLSDAEMGGGEI